MKFENAKVGDIYYYQETVKTGYHGGKMFFLPTKVERVTKTQIICDNGKKYTKKGVLISGSFDYLFILGEKKWPHSNTVVSDQTNEMKEFKQKLNLISNIKAITQKITFETNIPLDKLNDIYQTLKSDIEP